MIEVAEYMFGKAEGQKRDQAFIQCQSHQGQAQGENEFPVRGILFKKEVFALYCHIHTPEKKEQVEDGTG